MEAIIGAQMLTDADCASAFFGRLNVIVLVAGAISAAVLVGCLKACWQFPFRRRGTIVAFGGLLAFFWLIAAVLYFGTLATEGRRQTIAEEGVRGLSLSGSDLIVRYCRGHAAQTVLMPLSRVSDWAFYVQKGRNSVGMRLRFRMENASGQVEWPEYRGPLSAFEGVGSGPLARIVPDIASGIDEVVRTHPRRRLN